MRAGMSASLLLLCAAFSCLAWSAASAFADDRVDFHGKSVRMIVGSAPGGVTDQDARLVGRFIAKYLPGNPSLVVENVPGASGIKALDYFVQQVAPDGLTFIAGSSGSVMPDVLGRNPAVRYDPGRFEIFGGIANEGSVVVVNRSALPRLHDGGKPPVVMAQAGGSRAAAQAALWGSEYLGWNVKWVSGYAGTAEFILALLRGEADMVDTSSATILEKLLGDSRFEALVQTGVFKDGKLRRRDFARDVPLLSELLASRLSGAARGAFESWLLTVKLGKFFALPARTPQAAVAAFRAAFVAMGKDPEFASLARRNIDPDYAMMTGMDTKSLIEEMAATPEQDVDFLLRLRAKYGVAAPRN